MSEITTVEQLEALPEGTVLLKGHRGTIAWLAYRDDHLVLRYWSDWVAPEQAHRHLPLTVLYRPDLPPQDELAVRLDQAEQWFNELEQAAGMGLLADVAQHQRNRGLLGDHETRLRAKRVAKLRATVMEETEWRHQELSDLQRRIENSEARIDAVRRYAEAWRHEHWAQVVLDKLDPDKE